MNPRIERDLATYREHLNRLTETINKEFPVGTKVWSTINPAWTGTVIGPSMIDRPEPVLVLVRAQYGMEERVDAKILTQTDPRPRCVVEPDYPAYIGTVGLYGSYHIRRGIEIVARGMLKADAENIAAILNAGLPKP